jgi:hypothetical protein
MRTASKGRASARPPVRRAIAIALVVGGVALFTTSSASGAPPATEPGSAIAQAAAFGAGPYTAGVHFTVASGETAATYVDTEAKASAQTVNFGSLGTVLANTSLCGGHLVQASMLPKPIVVDSSKGPSSKAGQSGPIAVGDQAVSATPDPVAAVASATGLGLDLPAVLHLEGGATKSSARYSTGTARDATATATFGSLELAGGLVRFDDMQWNVSHRTGRDPKAAGLFSVGGMTIGGRRTGSPSPEQLAQGAEVVNGLLARLGMRVVLPSVTSDPDTGAVSVSPFRVLFGGESALSPVLQRVTAGVQPLRNALNGLTATGSDCTDLRQLLGQVLGGAYSVGDILLAALSPAGGVEVDIGGASAGTAEPPDFADPFGAGGPLGDLLAPPSLAAPELAAPSLDAAPPTSAPATTRLQPVAASASRCETTSPAGRPGCSTGAGLAVGLTVAVLGSALFAYDLRRRRLVVPVRREVRP